MDASKQQMPRWQLRSLLMKVHLKWWMKKIEKDYGLKQGLLR